MRNIGIIGHAAPSPFDRSSELTKVFAAGITEGNAARNEKYGFVSIASSARLRRLHAGGAAHLVGLAISRYRIRTSRAKSEAQRASVLPNFLRYLGDNRHPVVHVVPDESAKAAADAAKSKKRE